MQKNIYIVLNDFYHPREVYLPIVDKMFNNYDANITVTENIKDVINTSSDIDLVINFTIGITNGEEHLTIPQQQILENKVKSGLNMMYVHAGIAVIELNSPIYNIAKGRFVHHPEEHKLILNTPIKNIFHPILNNIQEFYAEDEHYFCEIDINNTTPLIYCVSGHGTTIGAWVHNLEKGKIVTFAQGHTSLMLEKMLPLFNNSIKWLLTE